jgi:hypothetical protein
LLLKPGFWRAPTATFNHETPVFACLNEEACGNVDANNIVQCPDHAEGPLCAKCVSGYVPDATATDGRCKACASTMAERWSGKVAVLGCAAIFFFVTGLLFFLQPAPDFKIDVFLTRLNVRRILRRTRKRALIRMHDNDCNETSPAMDEAASAKFKGLLAVNNIDAAVELRRAAFAARAAGLAATTAAGSAGAAAGDVGIRLDHAVGHAEAQAAETLETQGEEMLEGFIGSPDVDGSLEANGVGMEGLRGAAPGLSGVGGATSGLRSSILTPIMSLVSQAAGMVSPGQLKIALGNLQINASLTVVFAVPWPPVYSQFLEMLNVFKLDLFKGLTFVAPCLHSSHFMSLATFVAAPIVLVVVFAAAFGCAAIVICLTQRSPRACKRCAKKLRYGKATMLSASGAAVKLTLVVILFIYPTICSKVFTTFKCVDVGDGEFFMVRHLAHVLASVVYAVREI